MGCDGVSTGCQGSIAGAQLVYWKTKDFLEEMALTLKSGR